ncbi:aspartate/tyrosine/aromatic aminotransferase [Psychromonas sp. B3M02]|uniref:amino acid aminotransferase n=1 Tax=Psychromonas sp. B3M02 TaxID=2267226 RepID=UPI000DEA7090|nr:aromatic amino acid transaminase [Psychromonas sp. B3M02]RBW43194.1 aspartate/tyrosine/aromatic aminotransferase [Psychromonas sp. B3M02]
MLENLPVVQGDPLWALLHQFNDDQRAHKIDMLVGVYRDETGQTPVMQQVQKAELKLAKEAASKSYKMLSGNLEFNDHIAKFVLGNSPRLDEQCTIQTVGGSGALRVLADFIATLSPQAVVWNTEPGYLNHRPIMEGAGLTVAPFRWEHNTGVLDIDKCFEDLSAAKEGDVIILHGSCHNPSGVDPLIEQWQQLIDFCIAKKVVPLIDIAYQGFGVGPEEDAAGLRLFAEQVDLIFVATSCSKNMGLYCERTGAAMVLTSDKAQHQALRTLLERITRANYSMPPNHGSAVASLLFNDPEDWLDELAVCRNRINDLRVALGQLLSEMGADESLQAVTRQKGMFSMLPLTAEQMTALREKHAIYGMLNGRINIAGLKQEQVSYLANALIDVMK